MAEAARSMPAPGRRSLHLARAVDALRQGHWRRAEAELADETPEERARLMDEAFDLYHTEMAAQAEQLRDDQASAASGLDWFSTLFRSLPVPALMLDRDLHVVRTNDAAQTVLHIDGQALRRGLPLRRLLNRLEDEQNLIVPLLAGQTLQRDEIPLQNLHGETLWVDARLLPVAGPAADPGAAAFLAVFIDRTERLALQRAKNMADQARQAKELSESANRAKSELLSRVSHELRTPLNAILGFAQLLEMRHLPLDAQSLLWIHHIHDSGKHLLALVEEVLDLNQAEAGTLKVRRQRVELTALVRHLMLGHALSATDAGVSLVCEMAPQLGWEVQGDPTRVQEVLDNLLSNAVKYNRPGGEVLLRLSLGAGLVQIEVQDTGCGMDTEQLSHLFEPFNRLGVEGRRIPGRGLGLHIARTLARAMGGDLKAFSVPGSGSRFVLELQAFSASRAEALQDLPDLQDQPGSPGLG